MVDWRRVKTKEQLLAARARQLERREENLTTAAKRLKANRMANKQFFDNRRRKRQGILTKGDMVLLYNSRLDKQWSKKLDNRWSGPYLIVEVKKTRGTYLLSELDGTIMDGVFPGERLKRFFPRRGVAADAEDEADAEAAAEEDDAGGGVAEEDGEEAADDGDGKEDEMEE